MTPNAPGPLRADNARESVETSDGGFRLETAFDSASRESRLWFGVGKVQPGTESCTWSADEETHEAYYVNSGSLMIGWSGPDSGESVVGPGDFFFFGPNRTYTVENAGDGEALFVFAVTPAPAASTS